MSIPQRAFECDVPMQINMHFVFFTSQSSTYASSLDMTQLSFDASLRTEPAPRAIDFPETRFFQLQRESPNKLTLPTTADVRASRGGDTAGTAIFPEVGLFVKFGPSHRASLEEAQTLQAIGRAFPRGEVPVPELVAWRSEDKVNYIYMSLISGSTLQSCWSELTNDERVKVTDQLARILMALRSLRQREGSEYIGALDHGPVQAMYFRGQTVGPFPDPKEFNDAIQSHALPWLPVSQRPPDPYRSLLPDTCEIHFSHADLHLDNVMVSGTPGSRNIASIVDWGQAGWYPEFWEYCNMASDTEEHEWSQHGWIDRVLKSYNNELEAMSTYWSWRGPA